MKTLIALLLAFSASGQSDPQSRSWNQPVAPFRIAGNLYYVGASDITSYLLTTPKGHILIDGGFVETAPMIAANVKALGFRMEDVRILLGSHAHLDHAGGLAELKRLTGARFIATREEAPLYAAGGRNDPQFGDTLPFPPIEADAFVKDGEQVKLGDLALTAHITAGHTRGCTTWTAKIEQYDVVFLCSPSVPSNYRLVGNERYPNAVEDYRRQFAFLRSLHPDIFLASHGGFFDLAEKRRKPGRRNPFVDPEGYRKVAALFEKRFEAVVKEQTH